MQAPFFGAFHALAVDDAAPRARLALGLLATPDVERMMDAIERAVPAPQAEVIVHGASRRQVLGQRAPLAAGAQDVHQPVDHLAQIDRPLAAAALAGWGQTAKRTDGLDMQPFLVGQVARMAQLVPVVARAVLGSPHRAPREGNRHPQGITPDSSASRGQSAQPIRPTHKVLGRTLRMHE